MEYVVYVIVRIVQVLLRVLNIAMLLRAILSWLPLGEDNFIESLAYSITEPFIMPIRTLFDKMGWFQGSPLDMSFFFTYMLIMLGSALL